MEFYFFKKIEEPHIEEFRAIALHHNLRTSRLLAFIVGAISLVLFLIDRNTDTGKTFHYPAEYAHAIEFLLCSSCVSILAIYIAKYLPTPQKIAAWNVMGYIYAVIMVIGSLWITFVMQHNPSNTMSIFVLGLLTVAALWIFEEKYAVAITLSILVLFNVGLRFFQTDPHCLFTNYITGTCVAVFFLCISRVNFSINYNHFKQLKRISRDNEDMQKVNAMQTEILTVVAHDLHAPINNVITIIDMLKNPATTDDERAEFYDLIITTCRRSDVIIDDLLSVAKNDERSPGVTTTLLNDFIRELIDKYMLANRTTTNIVYRGPKELIYASINQQKIMRVFDNLISNAIKFTTDNGIINISLSREGDTIYISVRDNGIGIPGKMIPLLFSRFSGAGRTGLKGQKSYGLGLSICKLIMTQHHGDITVSSSEGNGTTMTMVLPAFEPGAKGEWDSYLLN